MKQIIRVEHADGWGMFRSPDFKRVTVCDFARDMLDRHMDCFNNPQLDGLPMDKDYFCAYKSIEHIQAWIKQDEFEALFQNDFKVYLIEVSECLEGRDNIIFKKEHILSKKDISELFITNKDISELLITAREE